MLFAIRCRPSYGLDHVDGWGLVFLGLHCAHQNKPLAVGRDVVLDPIGSSYDHLLKLSDQEKDALIAFLRSLSGSVREGF